MPNQKYIKVEVIEKFAKSVRLMRDVEAGMLTKILGMVWGINGCAQVSKEIKILLQQLENITPTYNTYDDDFKTFRNESNPNAEPILGQEAITPQGLGRVDMVLCDEDGFITDIVVKHYAGPVMPFSKDKVELINPWGANHGN